ncbi:MAG: acylphosphatase [Spirochaetales bacterium]|nr:acylphosphatase [Spirochaetales bacterium]
MIARRYLITGLVQGVGFRWFTQKLSRSTHMLGWVRNLPDGQVEVWAQAEHGDWESWEAGLRQGPPGSRISEVSVFEVSPRDGLAAFAITD